MLSINTPICRLCLTSEDVIVNIFSNLYDFPFKKMQTCLPIKVTEHDLLPQRICLICHGKVTSFHEFWNQTLQAEKHFRSLLISNKESLSPSLNSCNQEDTKIEVEDVNDLRTIRCDANRSEVDLSHEEHMTGAPSFEYFNVGLYDSPLNSPNKVSDHESETDTKEFSSQRSSSEIKTEYVKCEPQEYACNQCQFTTNTKSSLITHSKKHLRRYNLFCPECNISFSDKPEKIAHNIEVHDRLPLHCAHCNQMFVTRNTLVDHIKTHNTNCTHICEICGKTFKMQSSYKIHIRRNHQGNSTKVECSICGRVLSSKDHLRRHLLIHSDERKWVCAVCGKSYRRKCYLTEHSRIHDGIKPYKCDICGKCFTQRTSVTIHKRSHTGERPYKCEYCDKGFIISTLLRYHLKKCSLAPQGN